MKFPSFSNIFTARRIVHSRVEDIESRVPTRLTTDLVDDFFGAHEGISKSGSHQGRHVTPSTPTKDIAVPPPAYANSLPNAFCDDTLVDDREPPSYAQQEISHEPVTLAQYMFKFGFSTSSRTRIRLSDKHETSSAQFFHHCGFYQSSYSYCPSPRLPTGS